MYVHISHCCLHERKSIINTFYIPSYFIVCLYFTYVAQGNIKDLLKIKYIQHTIFTSIQLHIRISTNIHN